jgi:6-pyruvoyltetrahydropterin/6-carboxytetrahydropterin synthase
VVLPTTHPLIHVSKDKGEVLVTFREKRWIFPAEDCELLPVANTTAELLAEYIGKQLIDRTREKFGNSINRLIVAVDENRGQWGIAELDW